MIKSETMTLKQEDSDEEDIVETQISNSIVEETDKSIFANNWWK